MAHALLPLGSEGDLSIGPTADIPREESWTKEEEEEEGEGLVRILHRPEMKSRLDPFIMFLNINKKYILSYYTNTDCTEP